MKYSIITFLLTASLWCQAQQISRITGQVVDKQGKPVSYANVGILDTQIGTATNNQGYFDLIISTAPDNAYLQVSAISYKTYRIRISQLENLENVKVELKPHYFLLEEIKVNALDQDARNIVQRALVNWHKNYPQEKYQLQGFYRELLQNDQEYVSLVEAAFTMQDRGYHKAQDKRFRLDALRKSDDLRTMDSLDIYYDNFLSSNDLRGKFRGDYLDAGHSKWSFFFWPSFNDQFVDNFDFMLDSMTYYNGEAVYCISFFFNKANWDISKKYIEYNRLVISADNYAVIEMNVKYGPREITRTKGDIKGNISKLIEGKYFTNSLIRYRKYKGKWYPYILSSYGSITGGDRQKSSRLAFDKVRANGGGDLEFDNVKYNGKKLNPDKNNYYRHREVMITTVQNNKDGFKRIRNRNLMDEDTYVRDIEMVYDPEFWSDYNRLLINPYLRAAQKQLQDEKSLEEQFVSNGKR